MNCGLCLANWSAKIVELNFGTKIAQAPTHGKMDTNCESESMENWKDAHYFIFFISPSVRHLNELSIAQQGH